MNKPVMLTNYHDRAILKHLRDCFANCHEFKIMVSFLTSAGLSLLIDYIENNKALIAGQIIFTTEGFITDQAAFKQLERLQKINISVRIFDQNTDASLNSFHIKSYLFKMADNSAVISSGSANLTNPAFFTKHELNIAIETKIDTPIFCDHEQLFNVI